MFIKLRKRFINWLRVSDEYDSKGQLINDAKDDGPAGVVKGTHVTRLPRGSSILMKSSSPDNDEIESRGMNFRVIPGQGGIAVEISQYDSRKDEHSRTLHIIPEGEELSDALAKIITLQSLR